MEDLSSLVIPKDLSETYYDAIRKNLRSLMRSTGISQTELVHKLEQRGILFNQGNLSQFLSGKKKIQLSIIVHLCDIYGVSLAELVDENFGSAGRSPACNNDYVQKLYSDDLILHLPYLGDAFVTDPSRPEFQGYLQTYYVYMMRQADTSKLRTGTLTLEACGSVCEATLTLHTNKLSDGQPVCKTYNGRVLISTAVDAVYVLLSSPREGNLFIISFRHFHLPHMPLDCRIAAVMTNEAGEFHSPTMTRMFLSRTEIAEEHLPLLMPHLYLNTGDICIRAEHLNRLRAESSEYDALVDHLTYRFDPVDTYFWSEEYILGIARLFLDKDQRQIFLSKIRDLSDKVHLNKTSRRADALSRNLLLALGYYTDLEA